MGVRSGNIMVIGTLVLMTGAFGILLSEAIKHEQTPFKTK